MKITGGITRKLDDLGRIVIPIEMRRAMGVKDRDSLEILQTEHGILIRPYKIACDKCGETVKSLKTFTLCLTCAEKVKVNEKVIK